MSRATCRPEGIMEDEPAMNVPHTPPLPAWVRKRDGRLVPFESDRIARALFSPTEACGRPDAFLSRELADVALHFLAEEAEDTIPTTEQVREVVVKVLRELRQHALSTAFEEGCRLTRGADNADRPEVV